MAQKIEQDRFEQIWAAVSVFSALAIGQQLQRSRCYAPLTLTLTLTSEGLVNRCAVCFIWFAQMLYSKLQVLSYGRKGVAEFSPSGLGSFRSACTGPPEPRGPVRGLPF